MLEKLTWIITKQSIQPTFEERVRMVLARCFAFGFNADHCQQKFQWHWRQSLILSNDYFMYFCSICQNIEVYNDA